MPEYTLEDMKFAASRYYTEAEFDSALAAHDAVVRADQAEKLIQQITVEADLEQTKPLTDASSGRWDGLIAATAIIRAVVLTPTTKAES